MEKPRSTDSLPAKQDADRPAGFRKGIRLFAVDVEADGPAPGLFSMLNFGVVEITPNGAGREFYGEVAPISDNFVPEAMAVSGITREEHCKFPSGDVTMPQLVTWLKEVCGDDKPRFVSDNPGFDFQFLNYYLWRYTGGNPFGHSSRRIGDFYAGQRNDFWTRADWKKFRKVKHTHNPADDARGVANAMAALLLQSASVVAKATATDYG